MILVVDFGSQTAHLIRRRVREIGAESKIISPENVLEEIRKIGIKRSDIILIKENLEATRLTWTCLLLSLAGSDCSYNLSSSTKEPFVFLFLLP